MVRQALFSSLATKIPGCRFLDLFAGSGAVGLEAWSRDAGLVCWVESDVRTAGVLQGNIQTLCGQESGSEEGREWRTVKNDAFRFLAGWQGLEPFDIIFADPPYDRIGDKRTAHRLLEALAAPGLVADEGFFVMEQSREEVEASHPSWDMVTAKAYGGTRLIIYRRRGNSES